MEGQVFTTLRLCIGKQYCNQGGYQQNSRGVCKQKRITVDENFLCSLLVAPFLLPRAFLLIILVILAATANILVAAHTHLILVVLVTVHLMVGIIVEE